MEKIADFRLYGEDSRFQAISVFAVNDSLNESIINISNDLGMNNQNEKCCTVGCLYGRRMDSGMMRCCLCMYLFHSDCINVKDKLKFIWNCLQCRTLPNLLVNLQSQVQNLHSDLKRQTRTFES